MLEGLRQRSTTESTDQSTAHDDQSTTSEDQSTTSEDRSQTYDVRVSVNDATHTTAFRIGRLIYGGILAFMAVDGLRNAEPRVAYAESKNVPMPEVSNTVSHGLLLFGGAGIALWRLPRLAATAAAAFFLGATPFMHDFWAVDDPEGKQQQMTDFLKNAALLGGALAFLGIASWNE